MKRKFFINRGTLCLALCSLVFFIGCKRKTKEGDNSTGTEQIFMNKLRLSTDAYDSLKASGGTKLVLQFFYPGSDACQSPTLYAYAMHAMNQSTGKPPVQLQYDSVTTEPFTGRPQVLGDQQIRITSLDSLLKQVSGPYAGKNYFFLFDPKFDGSNPHIYYEVRLSGPDDMFNETTITNPSPPKDAF